MKAVVDILRDGSLELLNKYAIGIQIVLLIIVAIMVYESIRTRRITLIVGSALAFAISLMIHFNLAPAFLYKFYMENGAKTYYYISIIINVLIALLIVYSVFRNFKIKERKINN